MNFVNPVQRPLSDEEAARLFKALGHPTRLQILKFLLASGQGFCGEIVKQFPFSQSTISQHLKLLRQSGLIQRQGVGAKSRFSVNPQMLDRLKATLKHI